MIRGEDSAVIRSLRTLDASSSFLVGGLAANTVYFLRVTAFTDSGTNQGEPSELGFGITAAGGTYACMSQEEREWKQRSHIHMYMHMHAR